MASRGYGPAVSAHDRSHGRANASQRAPERSGECDAGLSAAGGSHGEPVRKRKGRPLMPRLGVDITARLWTRHLFPYGLRSHPHRLVHGADVLGGAPSVLVTFPLLEWELRSWQ